MIGQSNSFIESHINDCCVHVDGLKSDQELQVLFDKFFIPLKLLFDMAFKCQKNWQYNNY